MRIFVFRSTIPLKALPKIEVLLQWPATAKSPQWTLLRQVLITDKLYIRAQCSQQQVHNGTTV